MRVKIIIENDDGEESVTTYIEDLGEGSKKSLIEILSLKQKSIIAYPLERYGNRHCQKTGEFRAPKEGEIYLSGANPVGYTAHSDLNQEYFICKII